jgi:predicted RNase H-like HicB family nuclease
MAHMAYKIETEQETDGRWIAEILDIPGVMVYGGTETEAVALARRLASQVLMDN